ncbi:MAG TPA: DegT/DnrJ/EryC1/StrS family aminotransferase [candidate division Zixibacteria bacterium]|nr:DegT/DnrJ/EryC1/StrS family aminotransferase [candidate division Zixibacteria bacterium]
MKKRDQFLVFGNPMIEQDEIDDVVDSMKSGWLGTGPKVIRFQEAFREYIGSKHALAVNSWTSGMHLGLIVAGIGPGDEVITTPMTFAASVNVILHSGATPVFVDVSLPDMTIDVNQIEEKITPRTRAILPIHFAGRPCNMDAIMDIAHRHDLLVIEDAAHAIEGMYHGQKIGNIGHLTGFSFYVTKNIVTGEGGMITTNNDEWAEKIQVYGLHGMSKGAWQRYSDDGYKHYAVVYPGYKYNMMDIQAAIGYHQLQRIGRYLGVREHIWQRYDEAFQDLRVTTPLPPESDTVHARHLYTLLLDIDRLKITRDDFLQRMHERNIGTGVHFISVHQHPYYRETFGFQTNDFPAATYISERTVSLPLSAKLTDEDVADVIAAVREALNA